MADDQPEQSEKTEDPSQRKLDEARKNADVVKSQEVTTWFSMLGGAFLFGTLGPPAARGLAERLTDILANADQVEIGGAAFDGFVTDLAQSMFAVALLPLGVLAICAVAGNMLQHAPVLSLEPLKPKFSKISPIAGFKRLFSTEALINFAKGLLKLSVIGVVIFMVLWPERDRLETMMTEELDVLLLDFQQLALKVFVSVLSVVTLIAGADYLYQRHKWWNRQKMTVKEVRDEYKQAEGDPHVKSKIRQLRQERGRQRMMAAVPEAAVVITNPTHFAVALKYDRSMAAPVCVAKGVDAVALRIRGVAEEHQVPIVENPPLARALYAGVDIDQTIPAEHFKAVAQVIGYVMRLKERSSWRTSTRS